MWDDKLRKPHWGEEVRFKRISDSIEIHVQDWTYSKMSLLPLLPSREGLPGHITPALLTSTSIRPDSLSTLLMTLLRLSSSVTSKTIYQGHSEHSFVLTPDSSNWNHPFDLFVRKTLHRAVFACCRVNLAPRGSKLLTSSGLCQFVVFHFGQKAYSANPIPPLEQPVTNTTFDSLPAVILRDG